MGCGCGKSNNALTQEQRRQNIANQQAMIQQHRQGSLQQAINPSPQTVVTNKIIQGLRLTAARHCADDSNCPANHVCFHQKCVPVHQHAQGIQQPVH